MALHNSKKKKTPPCVEDNIIKKIAEIKAKSSDYFSKENSSSKHTKTKGKMKHSKHTNNMEMFNSVANVSEDKTHDKLSDKSADLMLKEVLHLGGTQEDYELLNGLQDEAEELEVDNTNDVAFNIAELVTFMKSNGLKVPKKEKKKNFAVDDDVLLNKPSKSGSILKICPFAPSNPTLHEKLIFKANEPWYTNISPYKSTQLFDGIATWKRYAQQLWDNEIELSTKLRDKYQSTDQQWIHTVLAGGTINDKISAHCLLLQESPVHHIRSLEALLTMAKKKSKRLSIIAVDTLKEIFLGTLLPDDRKLSTFQQHDFSVLKGTNINNLVLGWLVEDKLKSLYAEFIDTIKTHLGDNEVAIRTKLCNLSYQLLNEKPEKEQELLALIVNKIGDPDKKLASKIIYILGQLLQNHPSMKMVVASEIERVLFRANISERAQYYAICFLNQLQLSIEESAFAAHLIQTYFKFFKESIEHKNVDSRMLGGLLTGVNRSYPYTSDIDGITDDNIETLFKLVYVSNFNVSVQALMLLFQVSGKKEDISNRYYQALYSKLIDPSINSSSKKTFLLNLIYKSLKRDTALSRKVAIARRLLQVSNLDDPVLACASLYTISAANKDSNTKIENGTDKGNNADKTEPKTIKSDCYDCAARNPLYSNADRQNLWEFILLCRNYHPSVNEFVTSLLCNGDISYNGDPFNDFTRIKFLDKFVFKNPKKGVKATNKKFYSKNKIESSQPQVYSSEFREQKANKIHADEHFFYEYFKAKKVDSLSKDKAEKAQVTDNIEESLDFADDVKSSVLMKSDKKKKSAEGAEEDEESSSEYSYGDIADEADGTDTLGDKSYERFLWENLNSDGESIQGSDEDKDGEDGDSDTEECNMDEDGWEDISVDADSDDSNEHLNLEQDPEFVDAGQLNDIILKHKANKKRKRKNKPVIGNSEIEPPKKNCGKSIRCRVK